MDGERFDSLAKMVGRRGTRRGAFQGLTAGLITAVVMKADPGAEPEAAAKVNSEDFGCLDIGKKCNGQSSRCCSGRCVGQPAQRGKKRKNGKKRRNQPDRSTCRAHNEGGCSTSQDTCASQAVVSCGRNGACYQTTGNAPFCGRSTFGSAPNFVCLGCNKDKDCVDAGFGSGAACVYCPWQCELRNANATACVGAAN